MSSNHTGCGDNLKKKKKVISKEKKKRERERTEKKCSQITHRDSRKRTGGDFVYIILYCKIDRNVIF